MKKTTRTYDTPMLAMIKALNDHVGGEVNMTDLRDGWYFHQEHKDDNRFVYWLDATLELYDDSVKIIYKRNPGWYTEVLIYVKRELKI